METTRLPSKGQVIFPKSVRESHHWVPGTEFVIEDTPDGVLLRPIKPFKPTRLEDMIGCTGYNGTAKTLEEMEDAIAKDVKAGHARVLCGLPERTTPAELSDEARSTELTK